MLRFNFLLSTLLALSLLLTATPEAAAANAKSGKDKGEDPDRKEFADSGRSKTGLEKRSRKKSKNAAGGADYSVTNFLPVGVGQFVQGRPLVGGLFAGSELTMLLLFLDRQNQVKASQKDATDQIAEIKADPDGNRPDALDNDYLNKNENFVKKTQQEAKLAILGFFGLYTLGVIEAIYDPFEMNRKTRKATSSQPSDDGSVDQWAEEQEFQLRKVQLRAPRVSMFVLPAGVAGRSPAFGLTLQKSFY